MTHVVEMDHNGGAMRPRGNVMVVHDNTDVANDNGMACLGIV